MSLLVRILDDYKKKLGRKACRGQESFKYLQSQTQVRYAGTKTGASEVGEEEHRDWLIVLACLPACSVV